MGVVSYALLAYVLTAIISFGVVSLIVFVNYLMNRKENKMLDMKKSVGEANQ